MFDARAAKKRRRRRDPLLEETLVLEGGSDAPNVIEKLGAKHGLAGRWFHASLSRNVFRYFLALRK